MVDVIELLALKIFNWFELKCILENIKKHKTIKLKKGK